LSGSYLYGTVGGYPGYAMCMSQAIAIDGYGNPWVTQVGAGSCISNTIDEFSNSGVLLSGQGYTSNDLFQPYGIAIDGSGNAWAVNDDHTSVTEFSNSGAVLSGTAGYGSPVLYAKGIAIDSNGNVWIAGLDAIDGIYKIVEYSQSGSQLAIYPLNTTENGYNEPSALALDGAGNVWTANQPGVSYAGTPSISELSSSGSFMSGSGGYTAGGQVSDPSSLAVDPSGDVWVTNGSIYCYGGVNCNTVVEFIGSAVPVLTPIAAGLPPSPTKDGTSKLATRP
jgi:streptogramin lyase